MELIKLLEENDKSTKRERVLNPTTPSKQAEVYYRKQITSIIDQLTNYVIRKLKPINLTDAVEDSQDDYVDSFIQVLQELSLLDIKTQAETIASKAIQLVNKQNKSQIIRNYTNAFGIDLNGLMSDASISDFLKESLNENVELIISVKNNFIHDLGAEVFDSFKKGANYNELAKVIAERGEVSKSRAKFIARDQSAKINSDLQEAREKALGNDFYYWSGAGDERERESHRVLNGMLCKYSDPTVYSDDDGKTWKSRKTIKGYIGKCGQDYQCRCVARPYINLKEYGL